MVGIVGFVGEQVAGVRQGLAQHDSPFDIRCLTRRQAKSQRAAVFVAYGVDLGVAASLGAAYCL